MAEAQDILARAGRWVLSPVDFSEIVARARRCIEGEHVGTFGGVEVRSSVFVPRGFIVAKDQDGKILGIIDLREPDPTTPEQK